MSKKIYKGYELIKAIAEGEIKDGSRFIICGYKQIIKYNNGILYYVNDNFDEINSRVIISYTFELIEDETDVEDIKKLYINDKTIGKDSIENWTGRNLDIVLGNKINELIEWAKQQEKRIKKLEEK